MPDPHPAKVPGCGRRTSSRAGCASATGDQRGGWAWPESCHRVSDPFEAGEDSRDWWGECRFEGDALSVDDDGRENLQHRAEGQPERGPTLTSFIASGLALADRERTLADLHDAVREFGVADTSAVMMVHTRPIPRPPAVRGTPRNTDS